MKEKAKSLVVDKYSSEKYYHRMLDVYNREHLALKILVKKDEAGNVVSEGKEFPEGSLILGVPGKLIKEVTPEQIEHIQENADNYKKLSKQYK